MTQLKNGAERSEIRRGGLESNLLGDDDKVATARMAKALVSCKSVLKIRPTVISNRRGQRRRQQQHGYSGSTSPPPAATDGKDEASFNHTIANSEE
ncbi:hypothetical protein Dimus_007174 [Dionaea muscipula]